MNGPNVMKYVWGVFCRAEMGEKMLRQALKISQKNNRKIESNSSG